jgi:hypothetical protein
MGFDLFKFFISGSEKQVLPDSQLWKLPLSGKIATKTSDSDFTTGDYFLAACKFLSKDKFLILKQGIQSVFLRSVQYKSQKPFKMDPIIRIDIFLEKHGAFYHPLKVQVVFQGKQTCCFVLNGAVSKQGLALIKKEYDLLSRMNQIYLKSYLPQIYGFDFLAKDKNRVGFFLGQWFDKYKEFHVCDDQNSQQIAIWESDGSSHLILLADALNIFQEISTILTYYYNLETFEQITSWHHAAGDFIVIKKDDQFNVKLITIREYSPLTELGAKEKDQTIYILPALLFFFLDLTIRMRIDRLNGTGKIVLLDGTVINPTIKGFFLALDKKSATYEQGGIKLNFIDFFLQFDVQQISELTGNIVKSCYSDPLEITLIEENLKIHCKALYTCFKNIKNNFFY